MAARRHKGMLSRKQEAKFYSLLRKKAESSADESE